MGLMKDLLTSIAQLPRLSNITENLSIKTYINFKIKSRRLKKKALANQRRNQIEAQRSGFDLERRSSGMSAL